MAKKKENWMPYYHANNDEATARDFCIKNNIRISPYGIQDSSDHWHIAISIGPYKKGEKPHLSPSKYCRKTIWPEYYKMCKYYYDKYRK